MKNRNKSILSKKKKIECVYYQNALTKAISKQKLLLKNGIHSDRKKTRRKQVTVMA